MYNKILVWGQGYIGITTLIKLFNKNFDVSGVDINKNLIQQLRKGNIPLNNIDALSTNLNKDISEINFFLPEEISINTYDIHIICINTDLDEKPFKENLYAVLRNITDNVDFDKNYLIIIESTISPNWIDEISLIFKKDNIHFGSAPRRDWFVSESEEQLKTPRVIGGDTQYSSNIMQNIYSIVENDNIIIASNWKVSSMVKVVENTLRYLDISFANQLMDIYPSENITEILELCGSKWNIPEYHPSIGIGGYCIPLAPKYLMDSLSKTSSILNSAEEYEFQHFQQIIDKINSYKAKKLCILGISYAPNIKVHKSSPILKILKYIKSEIKICDPLYTKKEIENITGFNSIDIKDIDDSFDMLIIHSAHKEFFELLNYISTFKNKPFIIDNLGDLKYLLKDYGEKYIEIGESRW